MLDYGMKSIIYVKIHRIQARWRAHRHEISNVWRVCAIYSNRNRTNSIRALPRNLKIYNKSVRKSLKRSPTFEREAVSSIPCLCHFLLWIRSDCLVSFDLRENSLDIDDRLPLYLVVIYISHSSTYTYSIYLERFTEHCSSPFPPLTLQRNSSPARMILHERSTNEWGCPLQTISNCCLFSSSPLFSVFLFRSFYLLIFDFIFSILIKPR